MEKKSERAGIDTHTLVSIDGTFDFTDRNGAFYRHFEKDAEPLIEWHEKIKSWIEELRRNFGERLRHAAIRSHYIEGQLPVPNLCVNEEGRLLTRERRELRKFTVTMARNGVAARKSQEEKHNAILDKYAKHRYITVVPTLNDIHWSFLV